MNTPSFTIKRWTRNLPEEHRPDTKDAFTKIGELTTLADKEIENYVLIPLSGEAPPIQSYEIKSLREAIDWYSDAISKDQFLRELKDRLEAGSIEPQEIKAVLEAE